MPNIHTLDELNKANESSIGSRSRDGQGRSIVRILSTAILVGIALGYAQTKYHSTPVLSNDQKYKEIEMLNKSYVDGVLQLLQLHNQHILKMISYHDHVRALNNKFFKNNIPEELIEKNISEKLNEKNSIKDHNGSTTLSSSEISETS